MKLPGKARTALIAAACAAALIAGAAVRPMAVTGPLNGASSLVQASAAPASVLLDAAVRPMAVTGPVPALNYWLDINFKAGVDTYKVCGWNTSQAWACTGWAYTTWANLQNLETDVGGHEWRRGQLDVYWNGGGPGNWDTCSTNGHYIGYLYFGNADVVALGAGNTLVGPGTSEC